MWKSDPSQTILWVRFKDGASGRVRLDPEEPTGVLEPLRDAELFNRVYVDSGAVARPGDIDLAPDAMYHRIAAEQGRTFVSS